MATEQASPAVGSTWAGPLYIRKTDGTLVEFVSAAGVINGASVGTVDLSATGNTTLGDAVTDTLTIKGATTIQSTSATALAVGATAAGVNPALQVDASTASSATGLKVKSAAAAGGVALSAISSGTDESLTIDAKGAGTITLGGTSTGAILLGNGSAQNGVSIQGATTISAANTGALAVGPNGTTNPTLKVSTATASAATGLSITSAAAAGGLAVAVISSGTDENLTIDAKGAGTITLGGTSTGNLVLGRAATGVSLSVTGALTAKSGTAVPATAGAVAAGAPLVLNTEGITIEVTSDAPTHTRPKGSICINIGGSSTTTRMYVNTDGAGTWTPFTTSA